MKTYTQEEVRDLLRGKICPSYTASQMAADADVSYELVRKTLIGDRGVGMALPRLIGMKRKIVYVADDA